ncbi:MAG: ABC transporter permease [Candidatus Absconditabacteria bacterium]
MLLKEHTISAFRSIISNKLRAALSMLGIVIGVSAIIILLALGEGTTATIQSRFSSMGANLITLTAGSSSSSRIGGSGGGTPSDLLDDDLLNFIKGIEGVKDVSPTVTSSKQFIYETYNTSAQIVGTNPVYLEFKNLTIANGNYISNDNNENLDMVAVIGNTIANDAFGSQDPIGKEIKLENKIFTVIGVLSDNSSSNSKIYIPLNTIMSKIVGTHYYGSLDIQVIDAEKSTEMKDFINQELLTYLQIDDEDDATFTLSSMSELLTTIEEMNATMKLFLGGIASISLLVGGIGVMNIMLVSVTERTKEIGIRKALGATRSDILLQFLIESMFISIFAGIIGIGISFTVVQIMKNITAAVITYNSVVLAFGSVVFIGIVFGLLPARKAANLSPIDALRYE